MPLTAVNKTINTLLQGFLVLLMAALLWSVNAPDFDSARSLHLDKIGPSLAAVALVAATPFAMLLGIAFDRVGERFILAFIARGCEHDGRLWRLVTRMTFSRPHTLAFGIVRRTVKQELLESNWKLFAKDHSLRSAVEALMFERDKKETIEWIVQHYSVCRLSCGFMTILTVAFCVEGASLLGGNQWRAFAYLCMIYAFLQYGLLATAIDQYIYSYQAILHESLLILNPIEATTRRKLADNDEIKG